MSRRLPPLNPLRAFEAAARHTHVGRAAKELNVTHSAVSHQVRALENALGIALFERRGRRLRLSEAGQHLLPSVQQALDLIADASSRILLPKLEGRLTVYAPPAFAAKWLVRRLGRFIEAYPQIELTIMPYRAGTRDDVDKADLFIEYGSGHWERKWVRLIARVEFFPVCSPRLLNARLPLRAPDDLRYHTLLHDDDGTAWAGWLLACGVEGIDSSRGVRFANANLTLDAAIYGHGVALGDAVIAAEDLRQGALVRPFDFSAPAISHYYLVCDLDRVKVPMVQAFVEWLLDEVGSRVGPAA